MLVDINDLPSLYFIGKTKLLPLKSKSKRFLSIGNRYP